ncbi:glycosyltransferase [Elioraea tepidiphila]|jgi:glycosyltransferase involved in cell wall biosynthesis/predicted O-methyltransferase YrrM|uniref:glycosyltransferase n=1 Tax=Elioraea tepidiphila TaxID=457934 RepID=UPI002FDA8413
MSDAEALFRQVVAAYAEEGFPHEIIGQWTLPATDVADLVRAIRTEAPRTVLEVGTFVGLSTMLIALAGGGRTRVLSIDPNFPIEVEMRGMDSRLGSIDTTRRTQEIARAVAARLGIADRLDFVAGGFSSGSTFAARRQDPDLRVPVVGPEVCAARGPFDLAFIDGLHYADVVAGDVALASRHVGPSGVVLMHDCVGMWGTNVRAGIGRFLADAPEWRLLHPPFADLYPSIGTLFRPATRADLAARLRDEPLLLPRVAALRTPLATAVVRHTGARRILELHAGAPVLAEAFGQLVDVDTLPLRHDGAGAAFARIAEADPAATLVVSAGGPDTLADPAFAGLFTTLARAGMPALVLRTPPGEMGAACRFSRPLACWVTEAARAGLTLREWPPLVLAPSTFLYRDADRQERVSSALCNVVVAAPGAGVAAPLRWAEALPAITPERAELVEQQDLLEVHYANAFRTLFAERAAAQAHSVHEAAPAGVAPGAAATEGDGGASVVAAAAAEAHSVPEAASVAPAAPAAAERSVEAPPAGVAPGAAATDADGGASVAAVAAAVAPAARESVTGARSPLEALVDSALKHCRRTGAPAFGVLIDGPVTGEIRAHCLRGTSIVAVWTREEFESARSDRGQCGREGGNGGILVPPECRGVYFIGSPRRLTRPLLGQAWRHGLHEFRIPVAGQWLPLPLPVLHRAQELRVRLHGAFLKLRDGVLRQIERRVERRRPEAPVPTPVVRRLSSMDAAVAAMLAGARPGSDAVPGRVILVCGNLAPGGAERQVANTLVGLARAGLRDVSLLAHVLNSGPARHDFHLGRLIEAGIPAREIERVVRSSSDPAFPAVLHQSGRALPEGVVVDIANLVVEFRRARPEVVHAWLDWDCVRAGLAAAIAGVPRIVLSGRNLAPYHFALYQPYMDAAYRGLAGLANVHFLNNSRAGADDYADWIGIARERIRVIHNGIAAEDCAPLTETERAAERLRHGIPAHCVLIGGVFRFAAEKDPLLWLDAAALIAQRLPSARFILFGQGQLQAEMRNRAATAGIAERVTFAGVTDDPLRAMGMMDVFLLTSYGEGLPNVLIEAQAMGTAVVCTQAGGAPEAVAEGMSGTVVQQRDATRIAEAVLALAGDRAALARARREGPRFVRARFGMARMIAETIEAYGLEMPAGALSRDTSAGRSDPAEQPVRALGAA